jgi:DNA topoisomerase-2
MTNMHLFAADGTIKKYESALEVIDDFFPVRLDGYERRRKTDLQRLERRLRFLANRIRFIALVSSQQLRLGEFELSDVQQRLGALGFDDFADGESADLPPVPEPSGDVLSETGVNAQWLPASGQSKAQFSYLLNMPISQLTEDRKRSLEKQEAADLERFRALEATTAHAIWESELLSLRAAVADEMADEIKGGPVAPSARKKLGETKAEPAAAAAPVKKARAVDSRAKKTAPAKDGVAKKAAAKKAPPTQLGFSPARGGIVGLSTRTTRDLPILSLRSLGPWQSTNPPLQMLDAYVGGRYDRGCRK